MLGLIRMKEWNWDMGGKTNDVAGIVAKEKGKIPAASVSFDPSAAFFVELIDVFEDRIRSTNGPRLGADEARRADRRTNWRLLHHDIRAYNGRGHLAVCKPS